ncbi:DNA repair protein RecN [Microbacterium sp. SORGH_AS_0862]|uniref:DNA repair protein RecN n=1 Tax=Microbacterium sp. SORGH_AS_0862 TaxID=3041789 RepID=UPI00278E6DD8|nr:DNA repair protein RecN [Microbacterium sp. SORGH_AS_0862]MDQ1203940.1 DNA repair protein RecN (Recombination protein N) [Microbacterium sp. SORGH_AS_0862]
MIEEMRLRELGVIADATLPMGPGFTAITGETGAGKTMVVTGLGLLLGARADSGVVRSGAAAAVVEGVWIVDADGAAAERVREAGGDLDPVAGDRAELLLGRTLSAEGRSRATVGGRTAPVGVLTDLAALLVAVHGQSDQLRLRSGAAQRDALDRYAGQSVAGSLEEYRRAYERTRELDAELAELVQRRDERLREAEQLRADLAAIEAASPQPGEDAQLAARAELLANVEELRAAAALAHEALASEHDAPDASTLVAEARRALERVSDADPAVAAIAEQAAEISYRIVDLAGTVAGYLADLDETGPAELAAVEERRSVLAGLVRAHGSLEAALTLAADGGDRLAELDDDDSRVERLSAERAQLVERLDAAATALTAARREAADRLAADVTEELHALALPDARVEVQVSEAPASAAGRDEVAILLAPHPGAAPRPVSKGASGGELSRVMLAIEVVIAATDPVPTFVFDEVDAGIGGAAAIEVGRRLARLAETSQVIVVTHLAQVAAFATNHLSVVKQNDGSVTQSSVRRLTGAEREAEMARLLSGLADSDAALTHARELLALAGPAH